MIRIGPAFSVPIHEQRRSERVTAILLSEQPSTYGVQWNRLARLYLELLEHEIEIDGPLPNEVFWAAGVYYGLSWMKLRDSVTILAEEDSAFCKLCSTTTSKLDEVFRSVPVVKELIQIEDATDRALGAPEQMRLAFVRLHYHSELLPKRVQHFLASEPRMENRLRLFFGVGVDSVVGLRSKAVWTYLKGRPRFAFRDFSGEPSSKIEEVIQRLFSWTD